MVWFVNLPLFIWFSKVFFLSKHELYYFRNKESKCTELNLYKQQSVKNRNKEPFFGSCVITFSMVGSYLPFKTYWSYLQGSGYAINFSRINVLGSSLCSWLCTLFTNFKNSCFGFTFITVSKYEWRHLL